MIHGMIDIGSNTIRLAIYRVERGEIELLVKKKHMVGLAAYIEKNAMRQEGIDRACEVLMEYKDFLRALRIDAVTAFTTAALRNVDNSARAVREIRARTGIDLRVISGDEEARYGFIGATRAMEVKEGILIDIGGASTELVAYKESRVLRMASLPIGSLAMYTKCVAGLLPTASEREDIAGAVLRCVGAEAAFQGGRHETICGIGGTFKGMAKIHNEIFHRPQDSRRIEVANLKRITARCFSESSALSNEILALFIKVVPERTKTILPGMIIAETLAAYFSSETIIYSDSGVREGYLYDRVLKET